MDSTGGNMEFTGFFVILHFLFLFTSISFSSHGCRISADQSLVGRGFRDFSFFFFFLSRTAGVVASCFLFFFFWVGWRLAYKACIFFLFLSLNPSILVLGIAVTEIITEVFLFFSAQWRRK